MAAPLLQLPALAVKTSRGIRARIALAQGVPTSGALRAVPFVEQKTSHPDGMESKQVPLAGVAEADAVDDVVVWDDDVVVSDDDVVVL